MTTAERASPPRRRWRSWIASPPVRASAWAVLALPGWCYAWFLDGEFGPAGTDDWTMAEAWSGPLAWPIAGAFVAVRAGVLLTWVLHLVPRGRPAARYAARAVLVLGAPFVLVGILVLLLVLSVPLLGVLVPDTSSSAVSGS